MALTDGGPAFPLAGGNFIGEDRVEGMSLRDHFAAHALSAQILAVGNSSEAWSPTACAVLAYCFADAMLKAREAQP